MKFNNNIGNTDRTIRLLISVIFAILYFTGVVSGALGIILLVLAFTLLLTSTIRFCPLYLPFKLSTKDK